MVAARRRSAGFTLTEAMLTVAIVGILSTIGARLLIQVNRYYMLTKTRVELQSEARAIMYVISRNLHQARASTVVLDRQDATQPFYSRITFTKVQGTSLSFRQVGKELHQVGGGTKDQILSKNLRYLAFTFPRSDDMTIISVSLTLEQEIYESQTKALHMASEKVRVMN